LSRISSRSRLTRFNWSRALVFDHGFCGLAALERFTESLFEPLERAVALVARGARRVA
jgi:hypothetical protein